MFNVRIERECGCFKRSGMPTVKAFDNKDKQFLYPDDVELLPINDIKIIFGDNFKLHFVEKR